MVRQFIFLFLVAGAMLNAQRIAAQTVIIPEEQRFVYQKESMGKIILHSGGWGVSFKKYKLSTDFKKRGFEIDFVSMRHPKEYKISSSIYSDGRPYVFGKKNSLLVARAGYCQELMIFDKSPKEGVQILFDYSAGISLGLLKPVYLEIYELKENGQSEIVIEKYDEAKHSQIFILGGGPPLKGLGELSIGSIGGYAKGGLTFDFSKSDELIKALNVGVCLDIFPNNLKIFTDRFGAANKNSFLTFYVSLSIGKKS